MNLPQPGEIWVHYKNKEYEIIAIATNTETEEKMVVYRALYGNFDIWVRPLEMFIETIEVNNEYVYYTVPRFTLK